MKNLFEKYQVSASFWSDNKKKSLEIPVYATSVESAKFVAIKQLKNWGCEKIEITKIRLD